MTYRCGATQDRTVNLIDPAGLMVKRIEPLRTHAWEVELAAHGIDSASLNASSVQLEATCADLNVLDVAGELFDADVKAVASSRSKADSGLLTVDGWSQTALVTGIEHPMTRPAPRNTRSPSHCSTACGASATTCSISGRTHAARLGFGLSA